MVPRFAHAGIHDRHEFLRPVYGGADPQDGEIMPIKFLPEIPGEHEFASRMGMPRGKPIVE